MVKKILQLCADIGSDTYPYQVAGYEVILIGKEIGVQNYHPPSDIYGIVANPVCTDFSIAKNSNKNKSPDDGLFLVNECLRVIRECNPKFWMIENPATGRLKNYLGKPRFEYEPWWYGSPWTKRTALWGNFNIPKPTYHKWEDVPKNDKLYTRKGRKTSIVWLHKSATKDIPEFHPFVDKIKDDMSLRSLCSQGFANAFFQENQ